MQAATTKDGRLDGYANWADASDDGFAWQRWVIGKSLERVQFVSESGNEYDGISDDELALVNTAVRDAVEGASGLRYDFKQKSLLIEWRSGSGRPEPFSTFENLSDGQKTILGLVTDIARRMCLLNPHLDSNVTKSTPGVILIDELDVHPAVQFIATSHSPQILGELKPDEIILLRHERVDHPTVSYGLDSSSVLEEIMEADSRPEAVEALIREVFAALERHGEIRPRAERDIAARYMIELVDLNQVSLRNRRRAALDGAFDLDLTAAELDRIIEVYRDRNSEGRLPGFGNVIARYAEQDLSPASDDTQP